MVHTIDAPTVGNETKLIQLIHEILQGFLRDIIKLRLEKTLYDPEAIPVILFSETTP